jgi:hypothetical protein
LQEKPQKQFLHSNKIHLIVFNPQGHFLKSDEAQVAHSNESHFLVVGGKELMISALITIVSHLSST